MLCSIFLVEAPLDYDYLVGCLILDLEGCDLLELRVVLDLAVIFIRILMLHVQVYKL